MGYSEAMLWRAHAEKCLPWATEASKLMDALPCIPYCCILHCEYLTRIPKSLAESFLGIVEGTQ
jgi:hypothetical protein